MKPQTQLLIEVTTHEPPFLRGETEGTQFTSAKKIAGGECNVRTEV